MKIRSSLLLLPVLLSAPAPLQAQHEHHHGAAAERLGRVEFPTSCSAAAQPHFERGLALLHSFWWSEAGSGFRAAAEVDPRCAMAYWGMALVHRGNWFAGPPGPDQLAAGLAAAEQAASLEPPTERERDYVAALLTLFRSPEERDHRTRSLAFEETMGRVHERYPGDTEAAVFYALAITANATPDDRSFERQRRSGAILTPIFEQQPEHPGVAHYLIHNYDAPPIAHLGKEAARRYADIAPSVPHAQHMPSHIFTRLGMWEESIRANLASAEAARVYEEAQRASSVSLDRAHAWDYLVYAYLQTGLDREAAGVLDQVRGADAVASVATGYAFAAIPARYALERGRWAEAAALEVRPSPGFRASEAITHFARGIGAARGGALAAARIEVDALARIRAGLQERGDAYWSQVVEAQELAVSAWIAHAEGDDTAALRLIGRAAEIEETVGKHPVTPGPILPARELEGDLLMETNRPEEALRAYVAALASEPNRARLVFGAARAAERAGRNGEAAVRYAEYVALMQAGDGERSELAAARAFLARR
jgi:tetratricopeptide (TPR) repeat protein